MNTPLALFLLAALVGMMSFVWTTVGEWRRQQIVERLQVRKLRVELNARVNRCYYLIDSDWHVPTGVAIDDRLRQLGVVGTPRDVVVFPEFKDRTLNSLFWELHSLNAFPDVDWYAAQHGVIDVLEMGRLAQDAPRTTNVALRSEYNQTALYLEMLRSGDQKEFEILSAFRRQTEPNRVSPEEHDAYVRRTWPDAARLLDKVKAEEEIERKRKAAALVKSP